jgi:hypothetical protein
LNPEPLNPGLKKWSQEKANQQALDVITADRGEYKLVYIPSGQFMMGSPESEKGRDSEEGPLLEVRLKAFYYIFNTPSACGGELHYFIFFCLPFKMNLNGEENRYAT